MKRRAFLQSIGALGLTPMMPATLLNATPAAATAVAKDTYMWAETIVRAHNKCNLGMLQRLLQIDNATASVLKTQLLENGVISAQVNAYGMHSAVKPLYEGAFIRPTSEIEKLKKAAKSFSSEEQNSSNDFNEVSKEDESTTNQVDSDSEVIETNLNAEDLQLEEDEIPDTLSVEEIESEQEIHERTSG